MLSTAVAMAAAGLGVAIVPESVMLRSPYRTLLTRKLVDPIVTRNTAVIHSRDKSLSTAASEFIELLIRSTNQRNSQNT